VNLICPLLVCGQEVGSSGRDLDMSGQQELVYNFVCVKFDKLCICFVFQASSHVALG